ncbi:hypothetical protein VKA52_04920 [Halobacillus sp. HZG1]|uniref:hypothetical protein n=1 Tax=Halobacillus sp. HZG1 TaxID=3111769 RepID=UPI002DBB4C2A|nr:hypothetical protein [Halobacillus sp. HZG1]MEC3883073.1 hypothetical protein [Halobacillus sp. HZG1]
MYKILTGIFLLTSIVFAYLWFDTTRSSEIDTFTRDAATSAVSELPFRIEDVILSFDSYHSEEDEKANFYAETLLTRSLQQLTGNQRLLNAAERSSELEKGYFRNYSNELFKLRSVITKESFTNEESDKVEEITAALKEIHSDVQYIIEKESFTVSDKEKMQALTETIRTFNDQFLS